MKLCFDFAIFKTMRIYGYRTILIYCFLSLLLSGCIGKKPTVYSGGEIKIICRPVVEKAKNVFMAGSFNDWKMYDPPFKMKWDSIGKYFFLIILKLEPGLYKFKFIVDGEWFLPKSIKSIEVDPLGGKLGLFRVVEKK